MPINCRLLEISPEQSATLISAAPGDLTRAIEAAKNYSDVYRYWDAIRYLLAQRFPEPSAAASNWLELGQPISPNHDDAVDAGEEEEKIPPARLITMADAARLDADLSTITPDDLSIYYKASALDKAGVYPQTWRRWERTFDPLGQVLEHVWFLQQFVKTCAGNGSAILLYFEHLDEGSV